MPTILRILLALLLTLISAGATGVRSSAQESGIQEYTSELTGSVLKLTNSDDMVLATEELEVSEIEPGILSERYLFRFPLGVVSVRFLDGDVTPQKWNDIQLAPPLAGNIDFEDVLDEGVSDDMSRYLVRRTRLASMISMYYGEYHHDIGNGSKVVVYVNTPEHAFLDSVAWVQENITIDGEHVYTNVNLSDFQVLIDNADELSLRRIWAGSSTVGDWEDDGLVSETRWEAPGQEIVVTWDGEGVVFPFHLSSPFLDDSSVITLYTQDPAGLNQIRVGAPIDAPEGVSGIEHVINTESDEEYLRSGGYNYPPYDIATTNNAVSLIHSGTNPVGEVTIIIHVYWEISDGEWVRIFLRNTPELIAGSYTQFMNSVQINGEELPVMWTQDELEEMFPPSTVADTADSAPENDELAEWADLGLVSETQWNVPGYDIVVTWDGEDVSFSTYRSQAITDAPRIRLNAQSPTYFNTLEVFTIPNSSDGTSTTEYLEALQTSEQYIAERSLNYPALGSTRNDNAVSVVHSHTPFTGDLVIDVFITWQISDDVWAAVIIRDEPANIASTYELFINSVEVNGEAIPNLWTQQQLDEMLSSESKESAEAAESAPTQETSAEGTQRGRRSAEPTSAQPLRTIEDADPPVENHVPQHSVSWIRMSNT